MLPSKLRSLARAGAPLARGAEALGGAGRRVHASAATTARHGEAGGAAGRAGDDEAERTDPFTLKLQRQTEASYLELLAKEGVDGLTKEEEEAKAEIERRSKERGEWGGPKGPEPTRFGDWEKAGRCTDF